MRIIKLTLSLSFVLSTVFSFAQLRPKDYDDVDYVFDVKVHVFSYND